MRILSSLWACKRDPLIGVEMYSDMICLLQIKPCKKMQTMMVENFAVIDLPLGTIVEGKIKQPAIVTTKLTQLVNAMQLQGYPAAIALPLSGVITKHIKLAAELNEKECEAEVFAHLQQHLPGIDGELCHDFAFLETHDVENHDVLLVSTRQEQLNEYVDVVNQSGLVVKVVDVDCYALARAIRTTCTLDVIAILNINLVEASFFIVQNDNVVFSQYWIAESFEELGQNVKRAIQLYVLSYHQAVINHLVLSGRLPNSLDLTVLIDYLKNDLMLSVSSVNPFAHMLVSPRIEHDKLNRVAPQILVSCGLTLRSKSQW